MKANEPATEDPASLRRHFHEEIDRMEPGHLVFFQQVWRQLELPHLASRLDRDFDADRAAGKLAPAAIQAAIRAARLQRPYA